MLCPAFLRKYACQRVCYVPLQMQFAMYLFKYSLLCTPSNTVCNVPLQMQFAMYLFKYSLLCTPSNTVCNVPLQIQFAMYPFKYSLLCTSSNTVCYVPLQIQFAMYPFKYSLLCTSSNTNFFLSTSCPRRWIPCWLLTHCTENIKICGWITMFKAIKMPFVCVFLHKTCILNFPR